MIFERRGPQYRLSATAPGGAVTRFGPVPASAGGEVVAFALAPVTPNPSRGAARIDYAVAREARVRLTVIDVLGREVATLVDGMQTPGRHQAIWTGESPARAGIRAPVGARALTDHRRGCRAAWFPAARRPRSGAQAGCGASAFANPRTRNDRASSRRPNSSA